MRGAIQFMKLTQGHFVGALTNNMFMVCTLKYRLKYGKFGAGKRQTI